MQKAMDISQAGWTALAGREGIRTLAYKDSVGVWTIGVGHTAAAGLPNPCAGMEISHQAALDLFKLDLRQYVAEVNRAVKVDCTQNQFDAMVSLCFNIGVGGFAGSSVVRGSTKSTSIAPPRRFCSGIIPKKNCSAAGARKPRCEAM